MAKANPASTLPLHDLAPPASALFKEFRARFGLSRADAAPFFGVTTPTFAAWETRQAQAQAAAIVLARLLLAKPKLLKLLLEPSDHPPG